MQRSVRWISAREQKVQQRSQAIDIRTRRRLRCAILFGSGVARRAQRHRVARLSWLEPARNAKVDQVEMALRAAHDIRRFEIPEDDRSLALVQIAQRRTQLQADHKNY